MDLKYKSTLPIIVQKLVNRIETYSGCNIGFKEHEIKSSSIEKIEMQTAISNHSVEIRYDPRFVIEPNSVLHELLHIKRSWLEKVPQLRAYNAKNMGIAQMIDCQFEHLIIVPEEYDYGFNPLPFWEEKLKNFLGKGFEKNEVTFSRKGRLLFAYMQSNRFGYSTSLKSSLVDFISRNNYLVEIIAISEEVLRNLSNKIGSINTINDYLDIPKQDIYF